MASRAARTALVLLAAVAVAGCLGGRTPVDECDFDSHEVHVEVEGVDASLTRAGIHDTRGDVQAMACAVLRWHELDVDGPGAARGEVPAFTDVDQLWLFHEEGLLRVGTNVTVEGDGTLRLAAQGPPVRDANLTWAGDDAAVRWTEWYDDPRVLHPREAGTGERPLEDAAGNLTLPLNSSRHDGIRFHLQVDVNGSRHPNWSAYDGSREGVRLEATLVAPNGSTAARGNWTPANGTDAERIHVAADETGAAGNWTLRYRAHQGEAEPGDLVYQVEVRVSYGAPRR